MFKVVVMASNQESPNHQVGCKQCNHTHPERLQAMQANPTRGKRGVVLTTCAFAACATGAFRGVYARFSNLGKVAHSVAAPAVAVATIRIFAASRGPT